MCDVIVGGIDLKKLESRVSALEGRNIRAFLRSRDAARDTTWIDNMLDSLRTNGQAAAVTFVEGNFSLLAVLGLDITNAVLTLFSKGHSDAAQVILDSQMTDAQIKTQLAVIGADATSAAAARAKFYADLEKFGEALLPVMASLLVKVATGGIA